VLLMSVLCLAFKLLSPVIDLWIYIKQFRLVLSALSTLLTHTSCYRGDSTRDIIIPVFGMSWLQGVMAVHGAADPIVN
jgi:hypothetical protein